MNDIKTQDLIRAAIEARKNAYTPYSHFKVGAALVTDEGEVITGCNIENAAFTPGNCAERTAVFKAVSEGKLNFKRIAIVGGMESQTDTFSEYAFPCGVCRQVLCEFCEPEFEIIVAKSINDFKIYTLSMLLPESFGKQNLKK